MINNIIYRIVDLEKGAVSLQITTESKHTTPDDKSLHNEANDSRTNKSVETAC